MTEKAIIARVDRKSPLNLAKDNQRLLAARRKRLLANPTAAELHVKGLLEQIGERFLFQKGFYTAARFFIVDFYLPARGKLCLEVDGEYHAEERQRRRDAHRDAYLVAARGFRIVRITNAEAMQHSVASLAAMLNGIKPHAP